MHARASVCLCQLQLYRDDKHQTNPRQWPQQAKSSSLTPQTPHTRPSYRATCTCVSARAWQFGRKPFCYVFAFGHSDNAEVGRKSKNSEREKGERKSFSAAAADHALLWRHKVHMLMLAQLSAAAVEKLVVAVAAMFVVEAVSAEVSRSGWIRGFCRWIKRRLSK